jgi:hypothetical protein
MSSRKHCRRPKPIIQGIVFGGTSVTSLIRIPELSKQFYPGSYSDLADVIAEQYVQESKAIAPLLDRAFTPKEVDLFMEHGLFYGVHISPKFLALAENLVVEHSELLLDGFPEPYQLPKESAEVVQQYFKELKKQKGLDIDISSLVLADTTTPKGFEGKKILNPTGLNEKLKTLSELTTKAVNQRGVKCDSLYFLCTDSDSPHRLHLSQQQQVSEGYPLTPGLTMCGSTATMDGFDFKYMYRFGIIAQLLSNNIIGSRMKGKFSPFTFVGMLSPFGYVNGAIPTGEMGELRYEGNIDLKKEFLHQYKQCVRRLM